MNTIPSTVGGGGVHADGKTPRFREEDFRLLSELGPARGRGGRGLARSTTTSSSRTTPRSRRASGSRACRRQSRSPPGGRVLIRCLPVRRCTAPPFFGRAAERLGYHPYPAPTAANSVPYDGRPACNNCGFCAFFACPIHAKGDPVAMLQQALLTGRRRAPPRDVRLDASAAERQGRVTGVDYIGPDGVEKSMDAQSRRARRGRDRDARVCCFCRGSSHDLIGRYLMVHFQTIATGAFSDLSTCTPRGVGPSPISTTTRSSGTTSRAGRSRSRPAMDPRRDRRARRAVSADPRGDPLSVGDAAQLADARLAAATQALGVHHARRGSPGRDQPRRPGSGRPRRARFPGRTCDIQPHKHELVASWHHGPRLAAVLEEMGAPGRRS